MDGPEGGHYRDVFDATEVVATVPQDYREDTRNLSIILEAPEAVRACVLITRGLARYGTAVLDLFGDDEQLRKALRLAERVAKSYSRGRVK